MKQASTNGERGAQGKRGRQGERGSQGEPGIAAESNNGRRWGAVLVPVLIVLLGWVAILSFHAGGMANDVQAALITGTRHEQEIGALEDTLHVLDTRTAVMQANIERLMLDQGMKPSREEVNR